MTALALAPDPGIRYEPAAAAGADRVIRVSTAIAVLAVAGVAAYVSYWHAYAVVCAHGETGVTGSSPHRARRVMSSQNAHAGRA